MPQKIAVKFIIVYSLNNQGHTKRERNNVKHKRNDQSFMRSTNVDSRLTKSRCVFRKTMADCRQLNLCFRELHWLQMTAAVTLLYHLLCLPPLCHAPKYRLLKTPPATNQITIILILINIGNIQIRLITMKLNEKLATERIVYLQIRIAFSLVGGVGTVLSAAEIATAATAATEVAPRDDPAKYEQRLLK